MSVKPKKVHIGPDVGSGDKIQCETGEEQASPEDVQNEPQAEQEDTEQDTEITETEEETTVTEVLKESDQFTESEKVIDTPQTEMEEGVDDEPTLEAQLSLLRTFSSQYFLNKHTRSFTCLEQYLCSRSDLRVTLYFFPPLTDPGLDDALNYIPPKEEPKPDGSDKYIKMCNDLTIVPIKRVIKSLAENSLDLTYYGVTLKQMRGIADALKVNSNIKYLILKDNWMSPEATALISEVLRESNSIRVLSLRECRIGEEGAEKLCEGLASTQFLQELDLSFNSLGDKGLKILQPSLIENTSLKNLNISHNDLTDESAETLEQILLENKSIEHLDLSWSGFFTGPGNRKLCNGLIANQLISWLSLAWNGIGTGPAMRPITKYLRRTKVLEFLDLSWNRITLAALRLLRAALVKNTSLKEVKLGNNIYTPDEAFYLASLLTRAKNDLTHLDMENMCVNKDFVPLKRQLRRNGKTVTHGYILSNYEIHGPNINKLLFERCRYLAMKAKKKKMKKDFGHFILSLPDKPTTTQDFQALLKKKKIKKIDKDLLQELMSRFFIKHQKIDCAAMKAAYMNLYPDTVLPEEKKKKKKKGKKKKRRKKGEAKGEAPTTDTEATTETEDATKKNGEATTETEDLTKTRGEATTETEDPTKKRGEATTETEDPTKKSGEATTEIEDPTKENEEPSKKSGEATTETEDLTKESEEPSKKSGEATTETEDLTKENEEPTKKSGEATTETEETRDVDPMANIPEE